MQEYWIQDNWKYDHLSAEEHKMFCFEAVPLEAICPYRITSILWLQMSGLITSLFLWSHTLPPWHPQNSRFSFAPQPHSLWHQTSHCLFFEPIVSSMVCCSPLTATRLAGPKAGHLHQLHLFSHPGIYSPTVIWGDYATHTLALCLHR